jgi:hypothetical protein
MTSSNYIDYLTESDLEIFISNCEMAANEAEYLQEFGFEEVVGLPDISTCQGYSNKPESEASNQGPPNPRNL